MSDLVLLIKGLNVDPDFLAAALVDALDHDLEVIAARRLDRVELAAAINEAAYVYGDQPHPDGPGNERIEAVTDRVVDAVINYLECT